MYVLRSKKTGIDCGWSVPLWNTGAFEIVDDGSGIKTQPKVIAGIMDVTGLNLTTGPVTPVQTELAEPQTAGIIQPAPIATPTPNAVNPAATFVTDATEAAPQPVTDASSPDTVPASLFPTEAVPLNAEDNS
jgi:hypothetical protein